VRDGNGPAVSFGVTAQAALVDVAVAGVVVVVVVLGLVGVSEQPSASAAPAAPKTPSASRRVSALPSVVRVMCRLSMSLVPFQCCVHGAEEMLGKCSKAVKGVWGEVGVPATRPLHFPNSFELQ
jgi:hypothetical protein